MNTVYSGFVESGSFPFVVIDTGDTASTESEGVSILDQMQVGTALTSEYSTVQTATSSGTYEILNPWFEPGLSETTLLDHAQDVGFGFHVNGAELPQMRILPNGVDTLYSGGSRYPRINTSVSGALYISIIRTSSQATSSFAHERRDYASGVTRFIFNYGTQGVMVYIQVHTDGSIFFFSTGKTPISISKVGRGSGLLNFVGLLDSRKIYCLRPNVATASGVVYDAAGGTAPNCSVMAFNRVTGRLVGKSKSGPDGTYALQCIAKKGDEIFMVCLDDDGVTPDFDAQIIDRILV